MDLIGIGATRAVRTKTNRNDMALLYTDFDEWITNIKIEFYANHNQCERISKFDGGVSGQYYENEVDYKHLNFMRANNLYVNGGNNERMSDLTTPISLINISNMIINGQNMKLNVCLHSNLKSKIRNRYTDALIKINLHKNIVIKSKL